MKKESYFSMPVRFYFYLIPFTSLGLLGIAAAFYRLVRDGALSGFKPKAADALVLLMTISFFISSLLSRYRGESLGSFAIFLLYPMSFYAARFLLSRGRGAETGLFYALTVACFIVSAAGLLQYFIGVDIIVQNKFININIVKVNNEITSTLGHPNHLAAYLLTVLPFILFRFLGGNGRGTRLFSILTIIAGVLCLILTFARGGWMGIVFSFFLYAYIIDKRFFLILLLILIGFPLISTNTLINKIESFTSPDSYGQRVFAWQASVNMIKDRPVFGHGVHTFYRLYPEYKGPKASELLSHAHNIFLDIWVECGTVGIILFILIIVNIIYRVLKTDRDVLKKSPMIFYLCSCGAILLQAFIDTILDNAQLGSLWWFFLGGIYYYTQLKDYEGREASL